MGKYEQIEFERGEPERIDDRTEVVILNPGRPKVIYEGRCVVYKKHCDQCDNVFYTHMKRQHFCCEDCYYKYVIQREKDKRAAYRNREIVRLKAAGGMVCLQCGKPLTNPAAKYCCNACKQKAYREKHNGVQLKQ